MRYVFFALALLALFTACGDASYARGRVASANQVAHAARLSRPALPPPPAVAAVETSEPAVPEEAVGATPSTPAPLTSPLVREAALRHFFEALARLDDGRAHDDVRIVQYGDSHTAADYETGPIRRALQARFGEGGRGFLQVGKPWKWYVQEGVHLDGMTGWSAERGHAARGGSSADGMYGLLGVSIESSRRGARAWTDLTCRAASIELAYLEQPNGGSVDFLIDGSRAGRVATRAKTAASGYRSFDVPDGPHQIELQAVGDGPVRIFGVTLDRPQAGVTLDALGINGARVAGLLNWSEPHMAEQLRHRAPDLVVLQYGSNEAGDDTPLDVYTRQLVDVLGRIARATPSASCMLLGPPDRAARIDGVWTTMPRLLDIVAIQRKVAEAAGCAFYDQLAAMGGPGTIAAWALEEKPRAMLDRVHLSRDGYAELGRGIAEDLVQAYGGWRAEQGLPPVPARTLPSAPAPGSESVAGR